MGFVRKIDPPHKCVVPAHSWEIASGTIWVCDSCDKEYIYTEYMGPLDSILDQWFLLEKWSEMIDSQEKLEKEYNRSPWYMKYWRDRPSYWYTMIPKDHPLLNWE